MMWLSIVCAVALAYPVIAGMAYRKLLAEFPPEPSRCGGCGTTGYGEQCRRKIMFADVSINHPELYCRQCNAWIRWVVMYGRGVRTRRTLAMLWPLAPFYYLPKRLFAIGAGVRPTESQAVQESKAKSAEVSR